MCRRARKRLAVGLGRVERGTEEVGLRVDGAGRTRRGFAENGERTVVEVVGRELVLNKIRDREKIRRRSEGMGYSKVDGETGETEETEETGEWEMGETPCLL